jgi:predicted DNA-binding transcriptional regulator AlpA
MPSKLIHQRIPSALQCFDQLPDSANVRQPIVEALFACSSSTLWRRVKDGRIPRPRKLSDRVTAWQVGELRRALKGQGTEPEGREENPNE